MTSDLHTATKRSWQRFLDTYEPLRPELYRYCRHLTRSPWDAEDLVQDALARAFVTLAQMKDDPASPRAWLFRVASNLWIDQVRRRREVPVADVQAAAAPANAPQASREAAGTLLVTLSPQERAAVVLKDVFDLSLGEVADVLTTTVGAVKTALHRARGKLDEDAPFVATAPVPGALDAFCRAFNAGDLEAIASLLLDSSIVEVVGATTEYGPEAAKKTVLWGMLFGTRILADPNAKVGIEWSLREGATDEPPRVEARLHRGRWVLVHWYHHTDGDAVRAFTTVELDHDRITHLRNWFYNPELLIELGGELDVPVRVNGHRWWLGDAHV